MRIITDEIWLGVVGVLAGGLVACGGPLKYTVDDSVIANVPAQEKQSIVQAQQGVTTALDEKGKMEEERNAAERELALAKQKQDVAEQELDATKAGTAFWGAKKEWAEQAKKTSAAKAVAAQAHVELEKARLIQSKGITPTKDFDVKNFEKAAETTQKDAIAEAKTEEDLKKAALDREQKWRSENEAYQSALAKVK